MAGKVVQVIPPRLLDFGFVATGLSANIVLMTGIDAREWTSAGLLVRVTSSSFSGLNTLRIGVFREAPTPDDPGLFFVDSSEIAGVDIDVSLPPPFFTTADCSGPLGSFLRVVATGTRASAGNLAAMVGLELCL